MTGAHPAVVFYFSVTPINISYVIPRLKRISQEDFRPWVQWDLEDLKVVSMN